jgi:dual-action HEIGH metallo-peptidase
VGAILIPGTSSTAKVGGSIMNSCFRSSETGEWTSSDRTALDYLY